MKTIKNIEIQGNHNKPILADIFYNKNEVPKKIVIFCHGYKGYKDWGAWNLVADAFAKQDVFFIKMNFSHNGGTKDQPIDFPDLEAFGQNNFIKELDDLDSVISWIYNSDTYKKDINKQDITLIGHSRGGGIVLLKSAVDNRISRVITWASVSDFASRFPSGEQLEIWRKNGVAYITNARTKQEMPHYFQFYTNFKEHESSLTIKTAVNSLSIPYLILHGSKDETVTLKEAQLLNSWNPTTQLSVIDEADHSFGSAQPWESSTLPAHLAIVIEQSAHFLTS